ncbi:MAG: hypothetical protein A3E01_09435 [Gammaproteobacteria bacterium RIFCSPHIGHO2_12_FULL_63_22]|nr:MAG: hypothetical protein A3E01_09435 [Gammaproteobacteria bacterium RIFCSPHIGHO2_12_FULL_63_22]
MIYPLDWLDLLLLLGYFGGALPVHTHLDSSSGGVLGALFSKLTFGTPCVQNPVTINSTTVQAHGLSAKPNFTIDYYECTTPEQGFSVGDQISVASFQISTNIGFHATRDATNVTINCWAGPYLLHKATSVGAYLTPANWQYVSIPVKVVA